MNETLIEQLIDLLARWDAIIEDVEGRCEAGASQVQEAYYAGFAHGAQATRNDLARALACLMQTEGAEAPY